MLTPTKPPLLPFILISLLLGRVIRVRDNIENTLFSFADESLQECARCLRRNPLVPVESICYFLCGRRRSKYLQRNPLEALGSAVLSLRQTIKNKGFPTYIGPQQTDKGA